MFADRIRRRQPAMHSTMFAVIAIAVTLVASATAATAADEPRLLKTLKDQHAAGAEWWVYNDLTEAFAVARKENKPLFVTFRCVPCQACASFDAEVAQGSEAVAGLAREKFVPVRQVEMKGVDLSQFQFDYDLNWAAMFLNADGAVYARYGTQSAAGPDAYNSIEGLIRTMHRVLELHENYPANKGELAGKRGSDKPYRTALDMPGLPNRERYLKATTRANCIHCHNIHDAEHFQAQENGRFTRDLLWRYPLPENVGLTIDAKDGRRIEKTAPDSPAGRAGLKPGEELTHMNGQAITSIADVQWVLHNLPNRATKLNVRGSRSGERELQLAAGWKKTDISWRGSIWSVTPRLRVWAPELPAGKRGRLNLPADGLALEVRWINDRTAAGRAAKKAGLRNGDVIIEVDGRARRMKPNEFAVYVKLNYQVGQELPLTVLRDGRRREIEIELVE